MQRHLANTGRYSMSQRQELLPRDREELSTDHKGSVWYARLLLCKHGQFLLVCAVKIVQNDAGAVQLLHAGREVYKAQSGCHSLPRRAQDNAIIR